MQEPFLRKISQRYSNPRQTNIFTVKKWHSALEDGVQCAGQHDDEKDEVVVNDPLDVLGSLAPDHIWVKFC